MPRSLDSLPFAGRAFYADKVEDFLDRPANQILGMLATGSSFTLVSEQRDAWIEQIRVLRGALEPQRRKGKLYFEFSIPRLGKRIDVVALISHVIFVFEFKVGETEFSASAIDQVWDYALDLKNFHDASHARPIAPVLVSTGATYAPAIIGTTHHSDGLLQPICSTPSTLGQIVRRVLEFCDGPAIDVIEWESGRYCPTPTIVEAAMALYGGHAVADLSRSDASAVNLGRTSEVISRVIRTSRALSRKSICFVTGVPGAGKTLVGLNIATQHIDKSSELYSVFLSGNGPLVAILREALSRDKIRREAEAGRRLTKGEAMREVKLFIQNVHHFREECLVDSNRPPIEHVALFDEAQRAWNVEQTASFMRRKKRRPNFRQSEPEYLISCLDRHPDWAVVICLVGGGQEINTGEAGISEWIRALLHHFPDWHIHVSQRLTDAEYAAGHALESLNGRANVHFESDLHLGVSMRSFRAEHVSAWVKSLLDLDEPGAHQLLTEISERYPIVVTRDLGRAKLWLRQQARGSERYGIVVSSQAQRLKPHAIDVRSPMDPIHWFLEGKRDVRSSYFLEDVATEFHIQGLELDWACIVWDADFRYAPAGWQHFSFVGDRWLQIRKPERQMYLKNAYRVLLTRARQGMVIVVPNGDDGDLTRRPDHYDATFEYLRRVGLPAL
jgi:hypothetical protein